MQCSRCSSRSWNSVPAVWSALRRWPADRPVRRWSIRRRCSPPRPGPGCCHRSTSCASRERSRSLGTRRSVVPSLLFANAEPAVVNEPISPDLLAAVRSERRFRIVMEYTERALASHLSALLGLASLAYEDGNAIAMDDVGVEPMSLALLPVLEPDVVKLDMHLLRHPHLSSSVETAAIVASYAERTGAIVVAEGIETEDDLATARVLGAQWGQGWLFGQPGPLTALAGRPVQNTPRLRPPRRGGYLPPGTPFDIAAMGNRSRPCDQRTIDELTEYLLSVAGSSGSRTVILGVYPDQAVGGGLAASPHSHGRHRRLRGLHRPWAAWPQRAPPKRGNGPGGRHRDGTRRCRAVRRRRAVCPARPWRGYGAGADPRGQPGACHRTDADEAGSASMIAGGRAPPTFERPRFRSFTRRVTPCPGAPRARTAGRAALPVSAAGNPHRRAPRSDCRSTGAGPARCSR